MSDGNQQEMLSFLIIFPIFSKTNMNVTGLKSVTHLKGYILIFVVLFLYHIVPFLLQTYDARQCLSGYITSEIQFITKIRVVMILVTETMSTLHFFH